ncbi:MAG: transposase [Acidobacteriota bacterium]
MNPKALDHFRDLEGQPHKDDERDAYLLARMAYLDMEGCRLALSPTPEEQVLRRLSRLQSRVTNQRKSIRLRLRSQLVELCPLVVSSTWQGPSWSSASFLAVLERWPGLSGLKKVRISSIHKVLARTHATDDATQERQAQALKSLAQGLDETPEHQVIALEISCLVAQIRVLNESMKTIARQLKEQVEAHPVARKLLDVPGAAHFTAAMLVGELGPLARTCSEAKVATYAGLTRLGGVAARGATSWPGA